MRGRKSACQDFSKGLRFRTCGKRLRREAGGKLAKTCQEGWIQAVKRTRGQGSQRAMVLDAHKREPLYLHLLKCDLFVDC